MQNIFPRAYPCGNQSWHSPANRWIIQHFHVIYITIILRDPQILSTEKRQFPFNNRYLYRIMGQKRFSFFQLVEGHDFAGGLDNLLSDGPPEKYGSSGKWVPDKSRNSQNRQSTQQDGLEITPKGLHIKTQGNHPGLGMRPLPYPEGVR